MSTTTPRRRFTIEAVTAGRYTTVHAANWLEALGEALAAWDREDVLGRLACERLTPATMLARDDESDERYIVLDGELDDEDITAIDASSDEHVHEDVTWVDEVTDVAWPLPATRSVLGPLLLGGVIGLAVVALFVGAATVSAPEANAAPPHLELSR